MGIKVFKKTCYIYWHVGIYKGKPSQILKTFLPKTQRRNIRSFEKYPEKPHFQLHRKEERKFK